MTTGGPDWRPRFLALDAPATPVKITRSPSIHRPPETSDPVGSSLEPREQILPGDGLEVPWNFDLTAARSRFDRLAARLDKDFDCRCARLFAQDSACFGSILIPAEAGRSRTERSRIPLSLWVKVSKFGDLATYGSSPQNGEKAHLHPDDRQRIEESLTGLGYPVVPAHILAMPYDGPNAWVFGPTRDATWFTRFFDYL